MKKLDCLKYIQRLRGLFGGDAEQQALDVLAAAAAQLPDDARPNMATALVEFDSAKFPQALAVYTDGACRHNPGPGAWAVVVQDAQSKVVAQSSGTDYQTTNNRMELQAVIEGLKIALDYFKEQAQGPGQVILYSDSQLVVKGLTEWMPQWKAHHWVKKDKTPVENLTYWQQVDALAAQLKLTATWVHGHNGHPQNEWCDQLANKALDELASS
jgi:ribonuclease HI